MEITPEIAREIIDTVLKPYVPMVDEVVAEIAPVLDRILSRSFQYMREQNVRSVKFYQAEGIDYKDAVLLTINANAALLTAVQSAGKAKK